MQRISEALDLTVIVERGRSFFSNVSVRRKVSSSSVSSPLRKGSSRTYVVILNSPSRNNLRLWMGDSIHSLRHCFVEQIGLALREIQRNVDSLHASVSSSGGPNYLNRGR